MEYVVDYHVVGGHGTLADLPPRAGEGFAQPVEAACNARAAEGWLLVHVQAHVVDGATVGAWLYFERELDDA